MQNWEAKLAQRAEGEVEGFIGREVDLVEHKAQELIESAVAAENHVAAEVKDEVGDLVKQFFASLKENAPEAPAETPAEFTD